MLSGWGGTMLLYNTKFRRFLVSLLTITVVVTLSLVAIVSIWKQISTIEGQLIEEKENITLNSAEAVQYQLLHRQYEYVYETINDLIKFSSVKFVAVYKNNEVLISEGEKVHSPNSQQALFSKDGKQTYLDRQGQLFYIKQPVGSESTGNMSVLSVFSLKWFFQSKKIIMITLLFVLVFLVVITGLVLVLNTIRQRLREQQEQLENQNIVLKKTQEKLQDEINSRAKMIASISHDANKYLQSIIGNNDLFLETNRNKGLLDEGMQQITSNQESAIFLEQLLTNLLDNEVAKKGVLLRPEKINLDEVIQGCIDNMQAIATQKNVTIEYTHSRESVFVDADSYLIKRVLINILHNACKFTFPGGCITIRLVEGRKNVSVFIDDQGPGLHQDAVETIFKPYVCLDHSADQNVMVSSGAGLGLSNAKQFIQVHNGEIGVHGSEIGKGTTFYFSLPRKTK